MNKFYIVNDCDRPDQEHVVEMFSGKKATYIHPRLRDWNKNNGFFQINEGCTDLEDFGFSINIRGDRAVFTKVRSSVATYPDGKHRHWQGNTTFNLPLYKALLINKKQVWSCGKLPEIEVENLGSNIFHVIECGDEIDCFTNYGENKDRVVEQWFRQKMIFTEEQK